MSPARNIDIFRKFKPHAYYVIPTQDMLEAFLFYIDYFHDTIIRKIVVDSHSAVFDDGTLRDDPVLDVRIVFLSQFREEYPAFELLFSDATKISIAKGVDPEGMEASIDHAAGLVVFRSPSRDFEIEAKKVRCCFPGREALEKRPS